jgi:hypothetical protein
MKIGSKKDLKGEGCGGKTVVSAVKRMDMFGPVYSCY